MKCAFGLLLGLLGCRMAVSKSPYARNINEGPQLYKFGVNPLFYTDKSLNLTGIPEFDEKCEAVLEVAYLHDSTESYTDDVPMLQKRLPEMVKILQDLYPGSRFSLSQFRDKNIVPLGYNSEAWSDDCFALISSLRDPVEKLLAAVNAVYTAGGYDYKEGQLSAMMRAALAKQMQWTAPEILEDPDTGLPLIRVMVLTTDCTYHEAGDAQTAAALTGGSVAPNTLYRDSSILDLDVNALCGDTDYPTYEHLAQVLKEKRIIPVFLVQPCFYVDASGNKKVFPEFKQTAKETGESGYADPKEGMILFYRDLLSRLGLNGIVAPLDEAASDLTERLREVLKLLPEAMCEPSTGSTTVAPTTPAEGKTTTMPATETLTFTQTAPPLTAEDLTTPFILSTTTTSTRTTTTVIEPTPTPTPSDVSSTTVVEPTPVPITADDLSTPQTAPQTKTANATTSDVPATKECDCDCDCETPCKCCFPQVDIDIHLDIEV